MFITDPPRHGQSGMTLVETVIALGIGVIVAAASVSFSLYQGNSFAILTNMVDLDQANRQTMDQMSKDIRQAKQVTYYGTNYIILEDSDSLPLTYTYNSTARTLTRAKNGASSVLLRECEFFTFQMMQRNIVQGSYAYYPADDEKTCKVVGVTWACSRSIMGKKSSLTAAQTARIVIRKQ